MEGTNGGVGMQIMLGVQWEDGSNQRRSGNAQYARCATGKWKEPKEEWECTMCQMCKEKKVKSEKHFLFLCEA